MSNEPAANGGAGPAGGDANGSSVNNATGTAPGTGVGFGPKNPLMANEQALDYFKRNNYTKPVAVMTSFLGEEQANRERQAAEEAMAAAKASAAAAAATSSVASATSAPASSLKPNAPGQVAPPQRSGSTQSVSAQPTATIPPTEPGLSTKDMLKRNLPQAQTISASTSAYYIAPEHLSQAEELVQKQKAIAAAAAAGGPGSDMRALDVTTRIKGYLKFRQWIEAGLEGWKPELRELLFPVFVHSYLDLIESGYATAAKDFFAEHGSLHRIQHNNEITHLQNVSTPTHMMSSSLVRTFRTELYTVNLSKGSFGLLVGWLSDLGLEALWDTDKDATGHKDVIRAIVQSRLRLEVADVAAPLRREQIYHQNAFASSLIPGGSSAQDFNASAPQLKLAPPSIPPKLEKHLEEEQAAQKKIGIAQAASGIDQPDTEMTGVESSRKADNASGPSGKSSKRPGDDDLIAPSSEEYVPSVSVNRNFSTMDLEREVKAISDQRKRIKLGRIDAVGEPYRQPSLPSVCMYTVFDHHEGTTATALSEDASYLAAGSQESVVRLWDLKGKGRDNEDDRMTPSVRKLVGHSGPVYSIAFDPIGGSVGSPKHLLTSSQDGSVRLWSTDTGKNLVAYKGHSDPVWDVQWGPMGVYFASASRDRTARLWMTERIAPMRMYVGHLSDVECLRFHPNSLYLATGSSDKTCRLWDTQRGECVRVFLGHIDAVNCIAMSPDGRFMASASLDLSIRLWDLNSGREIKSMTGHSQPIASLTFSAESSMLVSGGLDNTVRCWDVKAQGGTRSSTGAAQSDDSSDLLATFKTKRTPVTTVQMTPRNLCMTVGTYQ